MTEGRSTAASRTLSEMAALGRRRRAARQDARDDHQPARAFFLGVPRERGGLHGVLRPRADDDRQAGGRQALDALHPLLESREAASRPSIRSRRARTSPRRRADGRCARERRNPGVDRRRRASSGPAWFRKKLARTCWRFLVSGRHFRHIRMSSSSVLDEKTGRRLKMGKTAPAPAEGDPAAALAAVLGRPFPAVELFDHVADIVFFIKDREARYVAVNQTLADRCNFADKRGLIGRKASEVFAPAARRAFRGPGSQGHRRGPLDPRPDGASSLSGRQRGLVPDLEGAAGRRRRRHSGPRRHFPRRAGFVAAGLGPGGPFRRARLYRRPSR